MDVLGYYLGKLGVSPDIVEGAINAIAFLLTEGARNNLSESDFGDSLAVLQYSPELQEVLKQAFVASKDELRDLLSEMSFSLKKFVDLDWRLDVQVHNPAGPSSLKTATPLHWHDLFSL